MEPTFERQLQTFIKKGYSVMPTNNEADLLRAGAGRREDQRLLADYVIGMIWLSWRYDRARSLLDSVLTQASTYLSGSDYLDLMRRISLLKHLPLLATPRQKRQAWADLEQEARLVVYLKTGRLA